MDFLSCDICGSLDCLGGAFHLVYLGRKEWWGGDGRWEIVCENAWGQTVFFFFEISGF